MRQHSLIYILYSIIISLALVSEFTKCGKEDGGYC